MILCFVLLIAVQEAKNGLTTEKKEEEKKKVISLGSEILKK